VYNLPPADVRGHAVRAGAGGLSGQRQAHAQRRRLLAKSQPGNNGVHSESLETNYFEIRCEQNVEQRFGFVSRSSDILSKLSDRS